MGEILHLYSIIIAIVTCATPVPAPCIHGDIRLVGGTTPYRGRVEVCLFNMWGTVCDHWWSSVDARVACRQLGYSGSSASAYSNAYFGQGSGPILLDNVACSGSESALVNCSFDNHTGDCYHSDDAGVQCYSISTGCVHGDIRLAGTGTSSNRGRVEVCLNNQWGTVCDDSWSSNDARVTCRQLGYSDQSAIAYSNALYGRGSGSILLDDVACTGTESRLVDCSYDSHTADCSHSEDAAVYCSLSCKHGDSRLVAGSYANEGRVEVCRSGSWGTVCDDYWSSTDARVVCRQLGFSATGATAFSNAYFGRGTGSIFLDDVACTGSESRLIDCTYDSSTLDCTHSEDASARCRVLSTPSLTQNYLYYANRQRLVHVNRNGIGMRTFTLNTRNAIAVDYDIRLGMMFWSDVTSDTISSAHLNGTGLRVLVNSSIRVPDGLAWDWVNKKLYWTDADDNDIEVIDPVTNHRKLLISTGSTANPRAIVLDPQNRRMYWTDWGTPAKIERASMDGTSRQVLHSTSLTWPNALTLDYNTQTLYWMDAWLDKLESSNADGSSRRFLSRAQIYHPFGVTFYQNRLYWTDWQTNAVYSASVNLPTVVSVVMSGLVQDPMGIKVVSLERQPAATNPCASNNGGCSHLCLLSNTSGGRTCACPDDNGYQLAANGRDCIGCVYGTIRLVGGSFSREGRVEVCINGRWGTVCDDYWGTSDANVVCGQLGYGRTGAIAYTSAFFGQGSGPILMDDLFCTGSERYLVNCTYDRYTGDCRHYEDAGVRCQSCTYGLVRLVGGTLVNEGRVEVCKSGQYGTVCDDFWGSTDAGVVCRQLGYSRYSAVAFTSAYFGQGTGSIWIDDARCTGSESRLIDCPHDTSTVDCGHSEDAGVRCSTTLRCQHGQLRLVNGTLTNEGRVEVCLNEVWGTVCDDLWSSVDANVACRNLGYSRFNAIAYSNARYGRGTGPILLDNLACTGTEYNLTSCSYDSDTSDCTHYEDAGVRCSTTFVCNNGDLRLAGSSVPAQGRVELCWNETWGTICDELWSTSDANVACRQLGYAASGSTPYYNAYFGRGTGPILLDDLLCRGSEARLIDCPRSFSQGIGTYDSCWYGHGDDAGVRCVQPCNTGDIRLVGGTTANRGRVEVCLNNVWGTVCDDYWSIADANVACRQLGYLGTNAIAYSGAYFGRGSGPIHLDDVGCIGSEAALINCTYDPSTIDCSHFEDAGVQCQICANNDIRLVGGTAPTEGRVELCWNRNWGTVCDDLWGTLDATVVCRQLEYSTIGAVAIPRAFFGQGTGSILLDNVSCRGTESRLIDCPSNAVGSHNCVHSKDAGVRCRNRTCIERAIRLIGGSLPTEGRVEVCLNDAWGTVCDDGWTDVDASVACRQLGYSRFNATAYSSAHFGEGSGSILLDDVACVGNESRLVDCQHTAIHNCVHNKDAGISCKHELLCQNGDIRLVNGSTAFEGRVEICWNETWGTICDGSWSGFDAQVACRQLGYSTTGYTYYSNAYFGQGFGPIFLDDLLCTGRETRIIDCPRSTTTGVGDVDFCRGHLDDAGLRCQESCPSGGIRLVGGTTDNEGRVEVCLSGRWGTVCDDYWSSTDARVACRQLGFSTTGAVAYSSAYFGRGTGPILLDDVACYGYESRLTSCRYDPFTYDCGHYEDAGVRCQGCTEGAVRLRGGTTSQGRVEVCRSNAWGTVCDDLWDATDANVVCKQLGFSRYNATAYLNAHFGRGSGTILLDDVRCSGTEDRLVDCSYDRSTLDCTHSEDAGVRCQITPFCRDGQLRLVGGTTASEGRVEICFNETWGTVCDDGWDDLDATVVCRKLQYSRYNSTGLLTSSFGQGTGPIFLDNVACVGTENSLEDCTHDPSTTDCTHHEDAAVQCNPHVLCDNGDIRLRGGSNMYEGRVEVCWNETWGTVCDGYWSTNDANVACRQLGFSPAGAAAYYNAYFGRGTGPILLDDLLCTGSEARLVDCTHDGIGNYDFCSGFHYDDAGVRCQPACTEGSIRLSGYTSLLYQGRVEVCLNRQWGTVCDDYWSSVDANVACRQLGFSRYNAVAYSSASFGRGSGPIHLDDVACTGTEEALVNCSYDSNTADCSHYEDAGVRCSRTLICNNGDVRLVARNGSTVNVSEGRVEICFSETWGTVSDDGWSTNDAGVVCRQLGFSRFNAQAFSRAYFGQGSGPIYLDNVACGTTENRLINCSFDMNTAEDTHAEDAGVRCSRTPRCSDGDIRLVGGTLEEEGRVEICMNEAWGTVCDDGWSILDANVVCRQLGYSRHHAVAYTNAHYGQGTGPILLDDVSCTGTESRLVSCPYDSNTADCNHLEDAGVRCNSTFICNNGDIRLTGGSNIYEGRVEICWNETWGTVCDGFWSTNDGNVACRQLGFLDTGAVIFSNAYFGRGTGPILLDDLLCTGREARLIDCPRFTSQGIGTYDFCPRGHGEDAGVRCMQSCIDGGIRLVGGTRPHEGRVEVCLNNRWGTVCDDAWGTVDASVACRQLGYSGHNATAYILSHYGRGSGPIHLDNVACTGTEDALVNCTYDSDTSDCSHFEDAGVLCQACSNGEIRLVGGSVPNEGRVEVCKNQAWGTVCDDLWGNVDARVTCRQLGYSGQNATAFSRAHFGQGSGVILLDNVACAGLEERLVNCPYDRHTADCYHYQDAGVRCSTAAPICQRGDIRLVGRTNHSGRVEICLSETWGTVCDNMWSATDANVVCRQLGFSRHNATGHSGSSFGQGSGPIFLDDVACNGTETRLIDCSHDRTTSDCSHLRDAGVTCETQLLCRNGDIRLVNGTNNYEGRVEICWNETWGTVCDGMWSESGAQVACRQLGYPTTGATPLNNAFFGQGTGPILLNDLNCTSTESRLVDCHHNGIGQAVFCRGHMDDAGLRCAEPCVDDTIRLLGGTTLYEGRVEVCKVGAWGTVCDDHWDSTDAGVACRQLGFSRHNANAYLMAHFGSGSTVIHLDDVTCTGTETSLLRCSYDIDTTDCSHTQDAGVRCTPVPICANGDIRLSGSSIPRSGRVEICWNETWGTVCDGLWTTNDGNVACRQAGYSRFGAMVYSDAHFGQGTGPILLDDLGCTGTETRLVDCPSNGIGISNHCNGHADDAGVQCQPLICQNGEIRLAGGATQYEGRVEVCLNETWGTVCGNSWDGVDANVACGQLGFSRLDSQAVPYATFGPGSGPILLNNVECNGMESALVNCSYSTAGLLTCSHLNDAGVRCNKQLSYPSPVIVEPASSTSINLTWGTPRELRSPIVMYNVNCTSTSASITVLTPDNRTMFIVPGLRPYTNYSCCVTTITARPLQGSSTCNYTTTPPDIPNAAPTRLQGQALNSSAIQLSWYPPPSDELNGVLHLYTITITNPVAGREWRQNSTTNFTTVSSLEPCTTYLITVAAFTIGYGPSSQPVFLTTNLEINGPQYSVTMSTVVLSPNSFTVVWATPSALINQQLRNFIITVMDLSTAVHYHSSSTVAAQANATTTFFQLNPYVPYQVNLTAFACGIRVALASETAFTQEGVPSVGPSIINVTRTSGTTASLLWVPLSIEDSRGFVVNYTVKYSQKSDILCSPPNTWTNATDLITHDVSYVISGLLPHISYCVVVSANTNAGAGVYGPPLEIPPFTTVYPTSTSSAEANSKQVQRTSTESLSFTSAEFSSGLHPIGRTSVETSSKPVQHTSTESLSSTSAPFSSGLHPIGRTSVEMSSTTSTHLTILAASSTPNTNPGVGDAGGLSTPLGYWLYVIITVIAVIVTAVVCVVLSLTRRSCKAKTLRLQQTSYAHDGEAVENPVYEEQDKFLKCEAFGSGPAPPPLPPPRNEKAAYNHSGNRASYIEMRSSPAHIPATENIYDNPNDANIPYVVANPSVSGYVYHNAPSDTYKNVPADYALPAPPTAKENTYENTAKKF